MNDKLIINSVIKTFRLIECVCGAEEEFTPTELAKQLNISLGSAQRITYTLINLGYPPNRIRKSIMANIYKDYLPLLVEKGKRISSEIGYSSR